MDGPHSKPPDTVCSFALVVLLSLPTSAVHVGEESGGRGGGGADRGRQPLKAKPTAFSTNESMSATRSLRLLAGYARQGARERPDGLLSQQPVDHERRGGERGLPGSEIEKWRTLRLSEGGAQSYSAR